MTSKYQRIIQDIVQGIEKGEFTRGQKLPSIRKLSQIYQCSKDTVQKAMLELKYQNVIYAVEKSGYYILEDKDFQEKNLALNPQDFADLPYNDFRICLNESLIGRENYLFNYYHQQEGLEELIHSTHKLLADYDVYCKKEQIVITAGSQQALYILSQMDFPNAGKDILLEEPTYTRMRTLVEKQALPYQTIERTLSGIDFDELEKIFQSQSVRFFYTIPRLHNPLGSSYSIDEKKELLRLSKKYQVYIIEDDYLADFDNSKTPPLHYFDTDGLVIYIKSFTTTLFPALRIGSVVLPQVLTSNFLRDKGLIDYDTNLIMQKALSLYIDNGMFARNTQQLLETHLSVQKKMQEILQVQDLSLPHQLGHNHLTIQVLPQKVSAALKHSGLPILISTSHNWSYIQLAYSAAFSQHLKDLLHYLN